MELKYEYEIQNRKKDYLWFVNYSRLISNKSINYAVRGTKNIKMKHKSLPYFGVWGDALGSVVFALMVSLVVACSGVHTF